jgi:hypothetical protein
MIKHSEHDYIETIKMTHTFPDGKKEEFMFHNSGNPLYECKSYDGVIYYNPDETKKIRVCCYKKITTDQYGTRGIDVHLGKYKLTYL